MDLPGPFPKSKQGNRGIVVTTNYVTKYAEMKALPFGTALEFAKFVIKPIVLHHSVPRVLITKQRAAFTAELTREVLRRSQTSHRQITA